PWSLANELLMTQCDTGAPIIFSTTSWSGREVVSDFCRLVSFQRRQRGDDAKPIAALGSTMKPSKHGPYDVPVIRLEGWIGAQDVPEPPPSKLSRDVTDHLQAKSVLGGAETTTAPLPQPRRRKVKPKEQESPTDDLDDELPW